MSKNSDFQLHPEGCVQKLWEGNSVQSLVSEILVYSIFPKACLLMAIDLLLALPSGSALLLPHKYGKRPADPLVSTAPFQILMHKALRALSLQVQQVPRVKSWACVNSTTHIKTRWVKTSFTAHKCECKVKALFPPSEHKPEKYE